MNYNFKLLKFLLLTLILFLSSSCSYTCLKSPTKLKPGSVSIKAPEVDTWQLSNGLNVVYFRRADVPLVSATLYIPRGSLSDDSGISGLSSVLLTQMREGGIKGISPDEFDSLLDMKAGSIEASQDIEVSNVSMSSLSEDFEEIFSYFMKIIRTPNFNDERLNLWKKLSKESIKRRKDSPETMASMLFNKLLYGDNSRWYSPLTFDSIDKITIKELNQMHERLFLPDISTLVVVGDFTVEEMKSIIEKNTLSWVKNTNIKPLERFSTTLNEYSPPKGIFIINSDFEQANILLGHTSLPRNKNDIYTEMFFNRVLGSSGFGSLLFKEIRERKGLVYSIRGGFDSSIVSGQLMVSMATKVETSLDAFLATYSLLNNLRESDLPIEEVEASRQALTNSYVFKFEDPAYSARRPVLLDLYDFPQDYDEKFIDKINNIKLSELSSFGKNNIKPDSIFAVMVGNIDSKNIKSQVGDKFTVCNVSFDFEPRIEECW